MWQRRDVPVVEVTASTPLKAHFDDSDACRKEEGSFYEPSIIDEKNIDSTPPKPKDNKLYALRTFFHHNNDPLPNHSDIYYGKTNWRSVGNLLLAAYATIFSGISLSIAIWQPLYGKWIGPNRRLEPSTADLIFSLIAKSIEIASAGVYINFLGQFLTRRSMRSRGIGLPDIAVREWLIQPGFIVWHWDNLKYASSTVLGFTSLLAAIAIYFYTAASNSLVTPHVALGKWEAQQFSGLVQQDFGNVILLKKDCWAPINMQIDPAQNTGESCANVLASGLGFQDLNNYMKEWSKINMDGKNGTTNIKWRPEASSSIFTDTEVKGTWVQRDSSSMPGNFRKYSRVVNNITLSMPHPVVFYSEQDEFPKPVKGSGFGEHTIKASVVSPTSNTLCVNMQRSEVAPLVYVEWPNARFKLNNETGRKNAVQDWFNDAPTNMSLQSNISLTRVADIFRWGDAYNRKPPIFPQWPIDYNSIANISVPKSDSIYLLIKSPATTNYTVCQMYGVLSQDCFTKHTQKVGQKSLKSDCGDDPQKFRNTIETGGFRPSPSRDFRDVLGAWATATGLNGGMFSNNGSLVRVVSQLVVTHAAGQIPDLNSTMPSIAETLAVLSNSMLMKASINATFDNRTIKNAPTPPTYIPYKVIVQTQQYKSGPPAPWQGILYPILIIMFAANWYCLTYFMRDMGLVVDFLEPQNLFSVAIESPTEIMRKQTNGGPVESHDGTAWSLRRDHDQKLVFKKVGVEGEIGSRKREGCIFKQFEPV